MDPGRLPPGGPPQPGDPSQGPPQAGQLHRGGSHSPMAEARNKPPFGIPGYGLGPATGAAGAPPPQHHPSAIRRSPYGPGAPAGYGAQGPPPPPPSAFETGGRPPSASEQGPGFRVGAPHGFPSAPTAGAPARSDSWGGPGGPPPPSAPGAADAGPLFSTPGPGGKPVVVPQPKANGGLMPQPHPQPGGEADPQRHVVSAPTPLHQQLQSLAADARAQGMKGYAPPPQQPQARGLQPQSPPLGPGGAQPPKVPSASQQPVPPKPSGAGPQSPNSAQQPQPPPPSNALAAMQQAGRPGGAGPPPPAGQGAVGLPFPGAPPPNPGSAPPEPQPHPSGAPPPGGAPPPPGGPVVMRELRVEDALLYLDDVKREFCNQPGVYNEFLTIMKNFKTQAVDTPGVIARVSKLFRGYNKLILGFNTFLPEGYKISLADLQRAEAERRAQEEAEAAAAAAQRGGAPLPGVAPGSNSNNKEGPQPTKEESDPFQQMAQLQADPKDAGRRHKDSETAPSTGAAGEGEDATMSEGQVPSPEAREPASISAAPNKQQTASGGATGSASLVRPKARPAAANQQSPAKKGFAGAPGAPLPPQQQQQPHHPVEFDHAISYVTQIKRRFANDPSTYHSFLEILHTYQKEQRGIKEVLEQVAHLFQDHPDLLKEFTFFLPDAVQEQAKERLHRAAAESESRLASQRQAQMEQYHKSMQQQQPSQPPQPMDAASGGSIGSSSNQQLIDMTNRKAAADGGSRKRSLDGMAAAAGAAGMHNQQPETYVYNSAVERQFFDLAKEALSSYSRDGGQAWAEFMKCLDMYAQEILSRAEMLTFVEPLLGKRNAKLFEEFKRILAAAGSSTTATTTPPLEDAWYSVPLSEIDFSRCRRCTPSYRALPRDYPAPPCTERSATEAKVLNDVWVSLPVGSEESYTFRHMRRNNYEEQLFRCEDERFEIDMVIDSNAATLQRLLPFAEEIARLGKGEPQEALDELKSGNGGSVASGHEGAGIGGKRFQYSFDDKNVLGVIHRNAIARIYGDSGQEMLNLMVKNPTIAIPLVVERLRQKGREWRRVRDRLRVDWRKLAEANYYKSLDHRSLTWRTTDKRATSTRTLLAEIKDRAQHRGKEGKEALRLKMEKAKEEHGTFFEVTMADTLSQDLDLTFLPRPDRVLFTPHLSVLYENNSWAQRDAYRILVFALERGAITPHDKERCHRLWAEFLGPWFGLSVGWMHAPAVTYQEAPRKWATSATNATSSPAAVISEEEEDDSMDDDTENVGGRIVTEEMNPSKAAGGSDTTGKNGGGDGNSHDVKDYHPLPLGSTVSTLYGEGTILEYRKTTRTYVIELSFGTAYMRPSTVLCSLMPAEKSGYTDQLRSEDRSRLGRPTDQLVIGTQSLFLVFRLHQILIKRLNYAMSLAQTVGSDKSLCTLVEQMPGLTPQAAARRRYDAYLALVYAVLDGGHVGEYEDRVRSLLGHGAYELATMDKLVSHIWKNLQAVAQDETMWNLIQLHRRHRDSKSFRPEAFRQEAAFLSDGEPMYAFQWCPIQGRDTGVLHFEYLGVIADPEDEEDNMVEEDDSNGDADPPLVVSEQPSKRQRR